MVGGGGWIQNPSNPSLPLEGFDIVEIAPAMGFQDFYAIATVGPDTSQLVQLSRPTGGPILEEMASLPYPALDVATGLRRDVFVLGPDRIERRDAERPGLLLHTSWESLGFQQIAFDDDRRELVAISTASGLVARFDESLEGGFDLRPLPTDFPTDR